MLFPMALVVALSTVQQPGTEPGGVVLLPSGWRIRPAGRHLSLDSFPISMVESADGRTLIVSNSGYNPPILSVIDLANSRVRQRFSVPNAWLGLVWHKDGNRVFSSAGGAGAVDELRFEAGSLKAAGRFEFPSSTKDSFVGGLSLSADGNRLFAVHVLGQALASFDLSSRSVVRTVPLPAEPYSTLVSPDGKTLFVSLWGGGRVLLFDPETLEPRGEISVGEHPSAMAASSDGARLFVACSNTNSVYVVDLSAGKAVEQVSIALFPNAPPGSTPNGLGLSPDGKTLLVASADNNAVSVVDVSRPGHSEVKGFIPTGWYPTAVKFTGDGQRILVLSGKGLTSAANPRGPRDQNYIGALLLGSLSILPNPDPETLAKYTKTVYSVTPYSDLARLEPKDAPKESAIPRKVGSPSPIKHVFYVIRENRTYDQVLGDLEKGNGDPNLCLFGEEVTPNAHALAREFVVLDNFYTNAEVSADGHAFSTAAYATDIVEKTWPMNYAGRGGRYLSEGRGEMRNPYGNVAAPLGGYLWDAARKAGVTFRSYGEFAYRGDDPEKDSGKGAVRAGVPGLEGLVSPDFAPWDLSVTDNERLEAWMREFQRYESDGKLPQISIVRFPNDHTAGTSPGNHTPRAMVADNDLALGRLVETISKSVYWKDSAIFVLEDDAQNGPDHVDAHRSPAFAISPYIRRGTVDSHLYTTSGMLRTIELILGLEPMSQYDAAATPIYASFQAQPNLAPYVHKPARVSLDERNTKEAYGAAQSQTLDLSEADRADAQLLNEILWRSVRGETSPVPPPVRAAFVRPLGEVAPDGDDR